jgi:hypothetical protein
MIQNLSMLEGRISNVLLLQFTARLGSTEKGESDFPQVSRKSYIVMLHRSLESLKFK